jgi:hypothetical protein
LTSEIITGTSTNGPMRGSGGRFQDAAGRLPARLILVSVLIIVAVLVSGLFYFQKMEATIADVV